METGTLLSVRTVDTHPQAALDLVAAAVKDVFLSDNIVAIERIFKRARGEPSKEEHYFQQVVMFSSNHIHFFCRLDSDPEVVLGAVCRPHADLDRVRAQGKAIAGSERL